MPPTVLIASTTWWSFPARLAMAFAQLGWRVDAVCGAGHPLRFTRSVRAVHRYRPLRPCHGLHLAMRRAEPDLIVPCDDRVVAHLHALHRALAASGDPLAGLIRRSLGRPEAYAVLDSRPAVLERARALGIAAPATVGVAGDQDLPAALAGVGLPAVIKRDAIWGGQGVAVIDRPDQAPHQLRRGARLAGLPHACRRWLIDRDPFWLHPTWRNALRGVSVQRHVAGRPANALLACWEGEVLAAIQVEVLSALERNGAATVARLIDRADIAAAGRLIVRDLGLSGFCGLDFIIADDTGMAQLIELNQRATQLVHFALPGCDPVAALAGKVAAAPAPARPAMTENDVLAFFPHAWHDGDSRGYAAAAFHDVPWDDPRLVVELLRAPRPKRGLMARCAAMLDPAGYPAFRAPGRKPAQAAGSKFIATPFMQ